jgi:ParB family chromosome partitioning protein
MAKNSIDAYGASGKTNVLMFEPEKLHLVTDKTHPLYDERIHLPISEAMVLNIMEQGYLSRLSSGKTRKQGWPVWLMVVSACVIPWRLISDWLKRVNHCWFRR